MLETENDTNGETIAAQHTGDHGDECGIKGQTEKSLSH